MRKLIKYFTIPLSILFWCCQKVDTSNFIKKETEINMESIRKSQLERGILTVSNFHCEYHIYSWFPLVYKDTFPNWIEDHGAPDSSFDDYKFKPSISDIDIPYVIFKKKNDNYFYIIKNKDTLKFKIEN